MMLSKKICYCSLFFLFIGFLASAQEKKYNHWSAELSTGIHVPLAPGDGISRKKYIAFKQFELAGRYMFNEKLGLKAHYAFNRFENPDNTQMGISMSRIGLEGVVNVGQLLDVDYRIREHIGLLFHTGLGVTFAKPSSVSGTDHMGNILVGFTGQIKLNDRFVLLGDMTYVNNVKQHYGYNGEVLTPDLDTKPGGFVNVSIGLIYNIGQEKYHADWY